MLSASDSLYFLTFLDCYILSLPSNASATCDKADTCYLYNVIKTIFPGRLELIITPGPQSQVSRQFTFTSILASREEKKGGERISEKRERCEKRGERNEKSKEMKRVLTPTMRWRTIRDPVTVLPASSSVWNWGTV